MVFEGKCVKTFACGALRTPKRLQNLTILVKSAPKKKVLPGGSADFGVFPGLLCSSDYNVEFYSYKDSEGDASITNNNQHKTHDSLETLDNENQNVSMSVYIVVHPCNLCITIYLEHSQ